MVALLEHLRLTIWICNFLGITCITPELPRTIPRKLAEQLFPLPFFAAHITITFLIIFSFLHLDKNKNVDQSIYLMGDAMSTVGCVMCMWTRAIYYRCTIKRSKELILQVKLKFRILATQLAISFRWKT